MMAAEMSEYQYKLIPDLMAGIRKDMRADAIPDNSAISLHNISLRDGIVAVDKGYKKFLGDIEGTPQLIFQHEYPSGSSDLILVTSTTVYERVSGEWNYAVGVHIDSSTVNKEIGYTTASAEVASSTAVPVSEIVVSSSTGFTTGCKVGIQCKTSASHLITGVTKGATTSYALSGLHAYLNGNLIIIGGFTTAAFNVLQTISSVSHTDTDTTIVTTLDSSAGGFGVTDAVETDSRVVDRSNQTLEHRTTITFSGSSTTWTLADALPTKMLLGARIVRPISLTGGTDVIPDQVYVSNWRPDQNPGHLSPTASVSEGASVVTNNIDTPLVICRGTGGVTVRYLDLAKITSGSNPANAFMSAAAALGTLSVKTVEMFQEKLCLGNVVEDGAGHGSRLRMSRTADYENFEADNGGEVFDLLEGGTSIRAVRTMGKVLGVYKGRSIIRGDYVGAADVSTRFHTIVDNEGAISTGSIAKVPGYHYIAGTRNVYKWNGGATLEAIGDPIREDLYTPSRFANLNMKEFIHLTYDPEYQELELFYPEGIIKGTRKAFRYSEQNKAWSSRSYTHYFTFSRPINSSTRLTWNECRQPWNVYKQPWNGALFVNEKAHRFRLLQGKYVNQSGDVLTESPMYVVDTNQLTTDELNYPVQWQVDTKDFYLPDSLLRVDYFDAYVAGDDVALWYSDDFAAEIGKVWNRVSVMASINELQAQRVYLNKAVKRIRFRLKGKSINFQLGWIGFNFAPEFSW